MEIGEMYNNGIVVAIYERGFITLEDGEEKIYLTNELINFYKTTYQCKFINLLNKDEVCKWVEKHPEYNIISITPASYFSYDIFYYNNIESNHSKFKRLGKLKEKSPYITDLKYVK